MAVCISAADHCSRHLHLHTLVYLLHPATLACSIASHCQHPLSCCFANALQSRLAGRGTRTNPNYARHTIWRRSSGIAAAPLKSQVSMRKPTPKFLSGLHSASVSVFTMTLMLQEQSKHATSGLECLQRLPVSFAWSMFNFDAVVK